jgi:hypothetical protein
MQPTKIIDQVSKLKIKLYNNIKLIIKDISTRETTN